MLVVMTVRTVSKVPFEKAAPPCPSDVSAPLPPVVRNYQYEQELNMHGLLSPLQTFFTELALLVTNNNKRNATRKCKPHKRKR